MIIAVSENTTTIWKRENTYSIYLMTCYTLINTKQSYKKGDFMIFFF
jgi:hypothetical protein